MAKRIGAIVFIYACTVAAWMILGGSVSVRTREQDSKLKDGVGQLWGRPQTQVAPSVYYHTPGESTNRHFLPLDASDISVDLRLGHRKKGLLWYSTYAVTFDTKYRIANVTDERRDIHFAFDLPVKDATYDDFRFEIGGWRRERIRRSSGQVIATIELGAGETEEMKVSYRSRGLDEWRYAFSGTTNQIKDFKLTMLTDFERIDFPQGSTSPTWKERVDQGWRLEWQYTSLLSETPIGMVMPQKLNPGPWVSRVCYSAPVSLFLFFFLVFVVTTLRKIDIHPMNYFFLSAAFFSFHLLLAYLVDHVNIHGSFLISSAVSILLVISYMRLVVGKRFAFVEVGISQFVYLVLFSYTFFLEGFTGLAVTVLCVITLFIVMQLTGRVNWKEVFKDMQKERAGNRKLEGKSDST